jgi:hypothetical protein
MGGDVDRPHRGHASTFRVLKSPGKPGRPALIWPIFGTLSTPWGVLSIGAELARPKRCVESLVLLFAAEEVESGVI